MHAGKKFSLKEVLLWTRRDIFKFIVLSTIPTLLYVLLDWNWLSLPWLPIALIGTAVAFLIGFKNNASYDRLWEGRKIWGAIVNSSRTWGIFVLDFVTNKHAAEPLIESELKAVHRRLIYRHIAWLTALRHQLRQPKNWENIEKSYNVEYRKIFTVVEFENKLEDELPPFLSAEDKFYVLSKKNRATHILKLQSNDLKKLLDQGLIEDFRHMEMENMLKDFYTQQGASERIKNFPYPRQFATINLYFVWLFMLLVPFGMLQEFGELGGHKVWLTIPFSTLVCWVFHTMEKIGEATENPFEGGANDVPMTALSRTIEIDLREMMDEKDIPESIKVENNILM
jgi:putative membrane protein